MSTYIIRIGGTKRFPKSDVQYLQGPRDAAHVKKRGYGFTEKVEEAWPFPSEKAAAAKAKIVEKHFSGAVSAEVVPGPV